MNTKTDIYKKWDKMSQKTKGNYTFIKVPFQRILPLMIALIIINELIMGNTFKNLDGVIRFAIIKLILSYILGVIIGHLEWNFFKNMSQHNYKKQTEIRNQYLLIYGLLFFGFIVMLSQLTYPFTLNIYTIVQLILWPISGLAWGIMMWWALGNRLNRYLNKED